MYIGVTNRHHGRQTRSSSKEEAAVTAVTAAQKEAERQKVARILLSGLITAVGLALHSES